MKNQLRSIIVFLFIPFALQSQNQNISNYLFPDTEPYIAVNPTNSNNLIAAWMKLTTVSTMSIATSYSNDGGVTWSNPQNIPHTSSTFTSADVSIDFNSSGTAYLTFVDYKTLLDSGAVKIVSSTNGGASWSTPTVVIDAFETSDLPVDRPWVQVDKSSGPYAGRIYVTSKNYEDGITTDHVYMKYSSDGGVSWSSLDILDDSIPCDLITSMGCLAIGADGSVNVMYISWHLAQSFFVRAVMVKSTDGGVTFTPYIVQQLPAATAINDTLQGSTYLGANPTNPLNLVGIYTSNINGDADILSVYSNDGGMTWAQTPIRVNDDPIANGNQQDMCWAGFSPNGTFCAAWRDRRNSGDYAVSPFEIWVSASYNGGASFSPNVMFSSVLSPDIPLDKGNDFIGVAASSTFLHVNWCDDRAGNWEIFYNRDSLSNLLTVENHPDVQPVVTVFPNPFSDRITFNYVLPADQEESSIEIVDANGKLVRTIYSGSQSAGPHEVVIDGTGLASGNYIFNITGVLWKTSVLFVKE